MEGSAAAASGAFAAAACRAEALSGRAMTAVLSLAEVSDEGGVASLFFPHEAKVKASNATLKTLNVFIMNFVTLFGGMPSAAASVPWAVYPEDRSRGRGASEPPLVHVLQEGFGKIVGAGLGQQGVGVAMGAERRAATGVVEVGADFGGGENPLAGEATAVFGLTDEGFVSDGIFVGILQYGFLQFAAGGAVGELADELLGNQAAEGLGS